MMANTSSQQEAIIENIDSDFNIQEQIQHRAYELFEQRGRQDGHDIEDWLQAESEVTTSKATKAAA